MKLKELKEQPPTEDSYKAWFLKACGILGDPVAGRKLIAWANDRGIKLKDPPLESFQVDALEGLETAHNAIWKVFSLSLTDRARRYLEEGEK